ncbi:CBS domain-containing protein [Streptomyces sp. NBC_01465]|uniref:CBS domain-containing protein n=1 Tax=Streptomyces sp. NBC_01465 TaxID=2903878 RepID=UPI002E2F9A4E|nr:CBS domain-containing protein [Streptomyces sp. NBC_01465]
MTLVQMRPRTASAGPAHNTAETRVVGGPQVWDDMSVEVALAVMTAARTGRLVVCDQDGRRTGLVTRAELTAAREHSAYTDHVRLRDIIGDHGAPISPMSVAPDADHSMRSRRLGILPAIEGRGSGLGVPSLSH